MHRVARKQREQQAVRGRIGEHEAVSRIAVLAYQIEKRGQVGRKQQTSPTLQASSRDTGCDRRIGLNATTLAEYLVAKGVCEYRSDQGIRSQACSQANGATAR